MLAPSADTHSTMQTQMQLCSQCSRVCGPVRMGNATVTLGTVLLPATIPRWHRPKLRWHRHRNCGIGIPQKSPRPTIGGPHSACATCLSTDLSYKPHYASRFFTVLNPTRHTPPSLDSLLPMDGQQRACFEWTKPRLHFKFLRLSLRRRRGTAFSAPNHDTAPQKKAIVIDEPLPDMSPSDEQDFANQYPAYAQTTALDDLRRLDMQQLDSGGETYVDWMGSAVFPRSLVLRHQELLLNTQNVFGNSHSGSDR